MALTFSSGIAMWGRVECEDDNSSSCSWEKSLESTGTEEEEELASQVEEYSYDDASNCSSGTGSLTDPVGPLDQAKRALILSQLSQLSLFVITFVSFFCHVLDSLSTFIAVPLLSILLTHALFHLPRNQVNRIEYIHLTNAQVNYLRGWGHEMLRKAGMGFKREPCLLNVPINHKPP